VAAAEGAAAEGAAAEWGIFDPSVHRFGKPWKLLRFITSISFRPSVEASGVLQTDFVVRFIFTTIQLGL
jgi:hypothetical protein